MISLFFSDEKNNEKGFIIIQNGFWWDIAYSKLKYFNPNSVRFEGEFGITEIYGSFMVLRYSDDDEKENIIASYQLVLSNKRK